MKPERETVVEPVFGDGASLEDTLAALVGEAEQKMERGGRVLHDDIGQVLSGVGMLLGVIGLDYKDTPGLVERLAELQGMLETAMAQTRTLSRQLNPSLAERAGLQFALEQLVARSSADFDGSIRLQIESPVHLPRLIATAFYRVAEYGVEHAMRVKAHRIEIFLKNVRRLATLEIRHDGLIPPDAGVDPAGRLELLKLHYYAQKAGIPVRIESVKEKGTNIHANCATGAEEVG